MPDRRARPGAASLRRDPVVLAIVGFCLLAAAWYLAGWGGQRARVVGFSICQPVLDVALAVLCRRVARLPGLPARTRRFWNAFAAAGLCAAVGDVVQVVLELDDPVLTSSLTGTAHQVGLAVGVCFPIWAMLTLPTAGGSRRERLTFWLDASTVMTGAAAFAWYFSVSTIVGSDDAGSVAGSVLVMVVELVAAFAVVKLMLTGAAGFVREAAFCGAVGVGLQGVAAGIVPTVLDVPWLPLLVAAQVLPIAMIVVSPRIQELRVRADPALLVPSAKQPYLLLPYLVVAATLGLLVVVLVDGGIEARVWGVLAGVVVSTALVVARQLAAFADNASLLAQLDVSLRELRRQEQQLRHQATHDHLTQLANRALFTQRAELAAGGADVRTSVVMIDLDDFKLINDTLGHHVGDAVLVAVAERLRACVRPGDTVARLGGDEFALLLPAATEADATGIAHRISAALAEPMRVEGQVLGIRASVGVASGTCDDAEALLRAADHGMYAAKRRAKEAAARRPREAGPVVPLR